MDFLDGLLAIIFYVFVRNKQTQGAEGHPENSQRDIQQLRTDVCGRQVGNSRPVKRTGNSDRDPDQSTAQ